MTLFEKIVYGISIATVAPAIFAVIVKACINAWNDVIDTGRRKDRPDGFAGDESGFSDPA